MTRYKDTIRGQFYGHTHWDHMRLFYEDYDAEEINSNPYRQCRFYKNRTAYDNRSDPNLERCPDLSNIMKVLLFAYMDTYLEKSHP